MAFSSGELLAQAPCTFTAGAQGTVSMDLDDDTPPFATSVAALPAALNVDITSTVAVEICFWGDMNGGSETWTVRISGQDFASIGAFGDTPTAGAPVCQTFNVNATNVENDLMSNMNDGDIDISYRNFGGGWTNGGAGGDQFNAQVRSVSFNYTVPVTLNDPADRCTDGMVANYNGMPAAGVGGGTAVYKSFPATPALNPMTGAFDPTMADAGDYNIQYEFTVNGCTFSAQQTITITASPDVDLKPTTISCGASGQAINLEVMYDGGNTSGGTWSIPGEMVNGNTFTPDPNGGCYMVTYTVDNGTCNSPYTSTEELLVTIAPTPMLTINGPTSPTCSTEPTDLSLGRTSTGGNPVFSYRLNSDMTPTTVMEGETFTIPAPAAGSQLTYQLCLTETNTSADCGSITDPEDCSTTTCRWYTVFNDGNDCGANAAFDSECEPDLDAVDVCEVDEMNNLALSCSFFTLNGPQLIEAELSNYPGVISCSDESFNLDWKGSLPGDFGDIATGGDKIRDINAATSAVCFVIEFEICIPLPIVDDFCLDPLPFPAFVEEACDKTIGEFVFDALADLVGGPGGSGTVVADTDGDGAFDFIVSEYGFPNQTGNANFPDQATIPNNVEGPNGVITVRNVVSWPFNASGTCGVISDESINLLELLPIGAIPIVGVIIEDLIAAASCNVDLVFTDSETIQIPVINNSAPEFANCNESGYVFSEDGICDTEVNWSVPVAYDGCGAGILPYRGRTAGTDATNFNGTPPAIVTVDGSGVYQTAGPIIGSDLEPGTYTVTYTAYSCSAVESTCTFDVVVTTGDPVLECPNNAFARTDVDRCDAVVTGLTPKQGLNCATILNYSIDFADGTTADAITPYSAAARGTHNDASGLTFPLGVSTVTYTMLVDINGDGDVTDENESQTCDVMVTVSDLQKPIAQCVDVDVQLDNTGNVTVYAEANALGASIDGGSSDNCDTDLTIEIAKPNEDFGASVSYDCGDVGYHLVTLRATDDNDNERTCLAQIKVDDFFEGIDLELDAPEICLEATNPAQVDFANYMTITLPDGTVLNHRDVENSSFLGATVGAFAISAFAPAVGSSNDPGTITPDGVYTPGTGSGYVTVSYVLVIPGADPNDILQGCFEIVHSTFEVRQPLTMESPECECIVQNDRVVNLGEVSGGLEPYTIQYGGVKLDVDSDGVADDVDGSYTFSTDNGHDISDFTQDLGNLLVDYTQPTWSFTIVDARGCELFRSGSCDNDDENGTPEILCEDLGPVDLFTEAEVCEAQYEWEHPLPTDNCDVILYTYTITNPDGSIAGPFDITALLNPDITNPLPDQFFGEYRFQHVDPDTKTSTVTYYAEDAVGNFTQCSFEVTVTDDDPPRFINCPEPAVIVDAPETWCAAFANYSLPLAVDNCSIPVVTQVDDTGLTSGDLYPVGITINTFEAVDPTGNSVRCDVKIIVNDYHTPPTYDCPEDVTQTNDDGDCGAVVEGIAPTNIDDNCIDNLTIVYRIDDEDGNEVASGFDDASGEFFELGTSTVSYSVQDMPLLLITEITHNITDVVDGTVPVPAFTADNASATTDFLEITNFNRANMDVSCLMIERLHGDGVSEEFAVPTGTILAPGETLTIHYGEGTNSPADKYFNVPDSDDLGPTDPAAYIVSLSRSILDVAVMNGYDISGLAPPKYNLGGFAITDYWTGNISPVYGSGIVRTTVWDTDSAADFAPGEACLPTTIGALNPGLAQPTPNGASTAIQAQPTVRVECSFDVTITDDEPAVCGLYGDPYFDYVGGPIEIEYGECSETVINVAEVYDIADLNLNLAGSVGNLGNLTITLISPEGTAIELADAVCAGTDDIEFTFDGDFGPVIDQGGCGILNNAGDLVMPVGDIEAFNGEAANGDWILQIGHNGQESTETATIESYILFISSREEYPDYTQTIPNDEGFCGAEFTWFHPILFDNCPGGTLEMTITFEDGEVETEQTLEIFPENTEITYFFRVGVTNVNYTLTDAAGNVSNCGFDLTVEDVEDPTLICPEDITIQLDGGECDVVYIPVRGVDWFTDDNCEVTEIIPEPDWRLPLPIGVNEVMLTVRDAAGNDTTCTYVVTVLEYIPENPQMACIGEVNVHIPGDCEQEIIPSMVLAGREYYCFDNYELTIFQEDEDGELVQLPDNVVGIDQIGETITYMVYDPRNDDTCWGVINVGFFEAPEFICPDNRTVSCNAATDTSVMGVPVLLSCALAGAEVTFADTLERFEACDDPRAILRRTWTVTDLYGNAASCVQTITIEAFDLDDVIFPVDLDGEDNPAISCVAAAEDPTLTDPENTGFPTVADGSNIFTTNFCSASYLYSDEVYNICAGSYEIVRTWKVRNTCQPIVPGVNPREAVQIIRVLDLENPVIDLPDDVTVSTTPFGCDGFHIIAPPVVQESCSNFTYEVSVSGGTLEEAGDGSFIVSDLAPGSYTVQYEVEDECGRYSEGRYTVTVVDLVEPLASCEDGLNVSLDGNGFALVSAQDVDKESYDHCSPVTLEIRRVFNQDAACQALPDSTFSAWGETVEVGCCDVNNMVTIELRVTDENQNSATCWTQVLVEDKLAPTCIAPNNVNLSCVDFNAELPADLSEATDEELNAAFGAPTGRDNCNDLTITQTISGDVNSCGVGQYTRVFTVTDGVGLTNTTPCVQQIRVYGVFDYTLTFPLDAEADCAIVPEYDSIGIDGRACDLITINTTVDTFRTQSTASEECFKLEVTYDIINWCEYNSIGQAYLIPRDREGRRNPETQLMYLHVRPGIDATTTSDDVAWLSNFDDLFFNPFPSPQEDITLDDGDDLNDTDPTDSGDDDNGDDNIDSNPYAQDDSRGFFRYVQFVKIYDEVEPIIEAEDVEECFAGIGENCVADVTLDFVAFDECSDISVTVELDADYAGVATAFERTRFLTSAEISQMDSLYTINMSDIPVGDHAIRVNAADGCGNFDVQVIEFCVSPDKAPTPICIQTLTVTLMPDGNGGGMGVIWATDFIASDVDDCFGNTIDQYNIYTEAEAGEAGFDPTSGQTNLEFTCDDFGGDDVPVRVYAVDANNNTDYCSVVVEVQAFQPDLCDGGGSLGSVAGLITTEANEAVENVEVTLEGESDELYTMVTQADGELRFTNLNYGTDYILTPSHFQDYLNGVRTSDIVQITRYILGVAELDSPYKLIAADVNGTDDIDVSDIIAIRRVILGLSDEFPNGMPSWTFIPAGHDFPVPADPWSQAFPEVMNFNNLAANVLDADFLAVKIGDVNGSAVPNSELEGRGENPQGSFNLDVDNLNLEAGETYSIPVRAAELNTIDGYQFTLEFDRTAIEVEEILPGVVAQGNFGWRYANQGLITTSWNWSGTAAPTSWNPEEVLFTIVVRANAQDKLSNVLSVGSRFTAAEAYGDEVMGVSLAFNQPELETSGTYKLLQNIPNPVSKETVIGFELPVAEKEVVIVITDAAGRLVKEFRQEGFVGYNSLLLTRDALNNTSGVYSYTVTAGDWNATKRMIVIE
ncbi:T9SS type A sorting domain-containing protein [Lewinella sp. W8]|uniref:T9SS type A sorting domain-containing protein n=1 Tax=Lewinella sp. W8 TaxID=2528208 RepID=UPI001564F918|nr:T9SS type A sorting domain-containing protein [Lewinella sp. W8]